MKQPFFILGNPRSGTSLFRIMLDSHSNIVVPPECGFIEYFYEKHKNWNLNRLNEFTKDILNSKKFETWGIDSEKLSKALYDECPKSYQEACFIVNQAYAKKQNKKTEYWGDKNNYYINIIPKIKLIFPEAKFIHLIRDGRDVATSYLELKDIKTNSPYKPNLPESIEEIAREWSDNNLKISTELESSTKYLLVKYEDLVKNPKETLISVTDFLEVKFDEQMLNYAQKNKEDKKEPEELMAWKKKTLENPDKGRIGKFHVFFDENEIEKFEQICSSTLLKYSYKLSQNDI